MTTIQVRDLEVWLELARKAGSDTLASLGRILHRDNV